jgi:hypothetical protein
MKRMGRSHGMTTRAKTGAQASQRKIMSTLRGVWMGIALVALAA